MFLSIIAAVTLSIAGLAEVPVAKSLPKNLPMTKLAPSKIMPNLCVVKYRVTTSSPKCQEFFDQGLGFFYSYVYMEAARSFETATQYDPDCAMAWWGLSRAIERWGKGQHAPALKKAQELMPRASQREGLLIKARLQDKGMWPGVSPTNRLTSAAKTLDELLTLYEDDEEGWFYRAQVSGGGVSAVPFYKALLHVNPLHSGAHHELVHFYENFRRPALGWHHAEKYIESSPSIPHAYHMQAHLATRIGRWEKTTDWSWQAVELERAYHKFMGVKPQQDSQFFHHLEILTLSLIHDGRFKEARDIKKMSEGFGYKMLLPWFRLHLAERDWEAALKVAGQHKKDKVMKSYLTALVYLRQGDPDRAAPEVDVLQEAYRGKRSDKQLELKLWEAQGLLLCQRGEADAGLKLIAKVVNRTKDDYRDHAWGNGARDMEVWGIAALQAGKLDVAEEAFLEALAHDSGSAKGALGMQVVCERQGRSEEAGRFADLAQRVWRRADPSCLNTELAVLRGDLAPASQTSLPPSAPR
jgi:tetratricopeptide (TPR) repeat protein